MEGKMGNMIIFKGWKNTYVVVMCQLYPPSPFLAHTRTPRVKHFFIAEPLLIDNFLEPQEQLIALRPSCIAIGLLNTVIIDDVGSKVGVDRGDY